ncbi:hypothetical protein jhhlp_000523 [Lomentospora prolificans]|uniref:Glycogen [starch] synthase n=1 Tax=Lomentospora prolificans TaxID=41688 RepID=A0A2N3NL89_9PEZI|nr:hypothetical protein jhhlp_000523 [Lomentospora prolificans]
MEAPKPKACKVASRSTKGHYLIEFCSELGRQVGGIYTVIKSKAPFTKRQYDDRYLIVGPLVRQSASLEAEPLTPPTPELSATLKALEMRGIHTVYGRWQIEGSPRVLLIDTTIGCGFLEEWRDDFARLAGIPLPFPEDDELINESIIFGYLSAWFMEEFTKHEKEKVILAHFHEWPAALGLLLIKRQQLDIVSIFTAHATVLGRELCTKGTDWYDILDTLDVDEEAKNIDHYHWHGLETAVAHAADLFTTVSDITAQESEFLLRRKPDQVLPNGLNISQMTAFNEAENLRRTSSKRKLQDFVRSHFYGHLDFNLEETLFFFIAGRYEFRNKGADIYIESLARLNDQLKAQNSDVTIVAFIIMPAKTTSIKTETLKGKAVIKSLKDYVAEMNRNINTKLLEQALKWKEGDPIPTKLDLITEQENIDFQRHLYSLQRKDLPPVCTHNLTNEKDDPILKRLKLVGLQNQASDRVKVVFYPSFLNPSDPVLPMSYYEFMRGTHLGIFPSVYEPWGYTAAECVAMGIPSITSNVTGFGLYMEQLLGEGTSDYGVYIVDRRSQDFDSSATQITEYMQQFCKMTHRERATLRHFTEDLSEVLDWEHMELEYDKSRRSALRLMYPGQVPQEEGDDWPRDIKEKLAQCVFNFIDVSGGL